MAKPIKETPILTGKDAKRFIENNMNQLATRDHAAIQAEKARILRNYNLLKAAEPANQHIKS